MKTKMTLDGGIFVVTNIKLVGGKKRVGKKADPNEHAPEMVASAPEEASVTARVTVSMTEDPEEYERAEGVRRAAHRIIDDVAATQTPLGSMAPHSAQEQLDAAILEARKVMDDFNKTRKHVESVLIVPWIVQMALRADEHTIRQVTKDMQDLLARMNEGIKNRDAEAIREAAAKAKMLAEMMDEEHGAVVLAAIREAKEHAKEVAKAVKDRGDAAISTILQCDSAMHQQALRNARAAFLDVAGDEEMIGPIAVPSARALDVEGDGDSGDETGLNPTEKASVEEAYAEDALGDPDATRAVDEDVDSDAKAAGSAE